MAKRAKEWTPAPKKVLGRLREIRICLGSFRYGVYCVVGPYADIAEYLTWRVKAPPALWDEAPLACCHIRQGFAPVIWLPRVPRSDAEYGNLAHEALHAVRFIVQDKVGMDLNDETQEAYCHPLGYLVTEILTELKQR